MHPFTLIPLLTCVGASVFAAAIISRAPKDRSSWILGAVMTCCAVWSCLEMFWSLADSPESALSIMRLASPLYMFLPALVFHLYLSLLSRLEDSMRWLLRTSYALGAICSVVGLMTPWFVREAVFTEWGYQYHLALPAFAMILMLSFPPVVAIYRMRRHVGQGPVANDRRLLGVVVGVPIVVIWTADVLLPLYGIDVVPLACSSIVVVSGVLWLRSLRVGRLGLTESAFAREILDTLPDGVALLGLDLCVRTANRTFHRLAGRLGDDLVGESFDAILTAPSDFDLATHGQFEMSMHGRSGRPFPVSVSATAMHDRRGDPIGYALVVRDQREVVELRRRLVTAGRLAAVGELAAGIAHEVNNPISFIQSNLNLFHRHYDEVENELAKQSVSRGAPPSLSEGRHLIGESLRGIARVASIVREVRGFAHAGLGDRQQVDLNEVIESAVRLALPQLRQVAKVERFFGDLPTLECAEQDLKQVFLNLVLRAGQTVGGSGTLSLFTEALDDEIVIRVEDDGISMPLEEIEHAFDLIFREDSESSSIGSGLELAISYQIVRQHGGEMEIESRPRGGTRVRVRLPLPHAGQGALDEPARHELPTGGPSCP